jgi:hypothetical protein
VRVTVKYVGSCPASYAVPPPATLTVFLAGLETVMLVDAVYVPSSVVTVTVG